MAGTRTCSTPTPPLRELPTTVSVHGAFAEPGSWSGVIAASHDRQVYVVVVANPLRSVPDDATYLVAVVRGSKRPSVLVGHSRRGMTIAEAVANLERVAGPVHVTADRFP